VKSAAHLAAENQAYVLQRLIELGPTSRADLARMANVPRGTIGSIVQSLIDDGTLEEGNPVLPVGRGKPARPLWFGARAGLCIGVQVANTRVDAGIAVAQGDVLDLESSTLEDNACASAVIETIARTVRALVARNEGRILGIGVAIPGLCDPGGRQVVACTPMPALSGAHVGDALEERLGLSVLLIDDGRALALGERWFGVGRTVGTFAAIQTGEGVGAGIVLEGRLYPPQGTMSEAGHTCVDLRGQLCRCGKRGCWETIAGRRWLRTRTESLTSRPTIDDEGIRQLAITAEAGGRPEAKVLREYGRNIAVGLANMALILGVRTFVLYGDPALCGETLRRRVESETRSRMALESGSDVHIILSQDVSHPGVLGAAAAVLQAHYRLVA
jgi:predicted NBD/HSP70 family sugar kinase